MEKLNEKTKSSVKETHLTDQIIREENSANGFPHTPEITCKLNSRLPLYMKTL